MHLIRHKQRLERLDGIPLLASAIVKALREGIEDVYPGDVAQEWVERWRENPKVLERELAAGS